MATGNTLGRQTKNSPLLHDLARARPQRKQGQRRRLPTAPSAGARLPFLPFSAPWIGSEEKQEILEVLASDWITTGPRTRAFEVMFREQLGCEEAVAVSSCTAALHLSLAGLGIGPQDAVLTTPFTFAATANAVVHCGAEPIFIDIQPDTYNLDPAKLEAYAASSCTLRDGKLVVRQSGRVIRAIIAVHYAGQPCDMDALSDFARPLGIALIEDAAHALGASHRGRPIGALSSAACFSFYPTKNITTGEGGMFTTNDPVLARRARLLSQHGISRDSWRRQRAEGSWQYDVEEAGFKYNLTDLAAALGIHQLRRLPGFLRRRQALAALYRQALAGLPLRLPAVVPGSESAWHLYPVQVMAGSPTRDDLIEQLRLRRIGTSVHFIPLHLTSYYQRCYGYREGDFPVAEQVFRRIVSLPLFPRMQEEDVERVARALRQILSSATAAGNGAGTRLVPAALSCSTT